MVLIREELLKNICDKLGELELSIKNRGLLHLYDQNLISEDFFADFLNILFDYDLEVLENISKNRAGIDLGDFKRRLSFQVSSTGTKAKIQKSIDKLIASQINVQQFDTLKILILGEKKGRHERVEVKGSLNFDPKTDVLNIQDLVKMLRPLQTTKLQALSDLMNREFKSTIATKENTIYKQTDQEALAIYRSVFDRPALQDYFHCERSMIDFEFALKDLIEVLNTGRLKGELIVKPRGNFSNQDIAVALEDIYHLVRALRSLYMSHVRSGEIDLVNNTAHFRSPETVQSFDNLKQTIIHAINAQLAKAQIRPIRGVS